MMEMYFENAMSWVVLIEQEMENVNTNYLLLRPSLGVQFCISEEENK